jgi:predicted nucleotidyltransferase
MISLLKNPRDRGERLARLQRYLAALGLERHRAIVFGSVARGDFTADSDTDQISPAGSIGRHGNPNLPKV